MDNPTPGPWSFDGPPHNIHVREARDPNMRVCFMTSDGPTEANARLIAAAPDLLMALAWVVQLHDEKPDDADEQAILAWGAARMAITKAAG